MLASFGSITAQQTKLTEQTMPKLKTFLDYVYTHPDAIITNPASDVVLTGHSDVSYFSKIKSRSRAGGNFFMSSNT